MVHPVPRSIRRPAVLTTVAAAVAGAAALVVPAAPAAAATCTESLNDVVVGAPRYNGARGVVDVQRVSGADQRITRSTVEPGTGSTGDEFGRAIARTERVRTQSGSGCGVIAIGAPGADGRGAVYVTTDSASGFGASGTVKIAAPKGAAGDRFGETVLISRAVADDTNSYELWVGAPRRDVGSAVDAGVIERYSLRLIPETGRFELEHQQTLRQGSPSIPGTTAESNDRFGEVLAGAEYGVVVGVPHEDVGSAVDAGMVTLIGPTDDTYRAVHSITQSTAGIAGAAESGDRFGAAVTPCAHAIGVPGEDVGSARDAGLVQLLRGCDLINLRPGLALTQATAGVPGSVEAGDGFGAAVAERFTAEDGAALFIGSPGEDVGSVANAGSVTAQYSCGTDDCGWALLTQGHGLPGAAEAGDAVGSALGLRQHYRVDDSSRIHETSYPLVGAPGEDVGSTTDAGAAYTRRSTDAGGTAQVSIGFSGGPRTGLRFGSVFAADVYGYPLG